MFDAYLLDLLAQKDVVTDRQTDRQTDISISWAAFAAEKVDKICCDMVIVCVRTISKAFKALEKFAFSIFVPSLYKAKPATTTNHQLRHPIPSSPSGPGGLKIKITSLSKFGYLVLVNWTLLFMLVPDTVTQTLKHQSLAPRWTLEQSLLKGI